jgi:hypothetical protein
MGPNMNAEGMGPQVEEAPSGEGRQKTVGQWMQRKGTRGHGARCPLTYRKGLLQRDALDGKARVVGNVTHHHPPVLHLGAGVPRCVHHTQTRRVQHLGVFPREVHSEGHSFLCGNRVLALNLVRHRNVGVPVAEPGHVRKLDRNTPTAIENTVIVATTSKP